MGTYQLPSSHHYYVSWHKYNFFFFFFLLDWSISSVRYREGSQLGLEKEVSQINSSYSKLTLHWFSAVKNLPAKQETQVHFLGWEDPLEKEMATQSNSLAWEILG